MLIDKRSRQRPRVSDVTIVHPEVATAHISYLSRDFSNAADIYSVNEAVSGCFQHAKAATRPMGVFFICLAQCESGGYVFPAMRVGEGMCRG